MLKTLLKKLGIKKFDDYLKKRLASKEIEEKICYPVVIKYEDIKNEIIPRAKAMNPKIFKSEKLGVIGGFIHLNVISEIHLNKDNLCGSAIMISIYNHETCLTHFIPLEVLFPELTQESGKKPNLKLV